jgi:hypothetical protein
MMPSEPPGSTSAAATSKPPFAALALSLSVQDWTELGADELTGPTPDLDVLVDRVASLLLVRLVGVATRPADLSTAGICRSALLRGLQGWPDPVTPAVVNQTVRYSRAILTLYTESNPYHNAQHAAHVVVSAARMADQMLLASMGNGKSKKGSNKTKNRKLFGLRHDPVAWLSLVFAALIHDASHPGVPNRQLSSEDDELAILYNDQSIAENHSLRIGFEELIKPEYKDLRSLLLVGSSAAGSSGGARGSSSSDPTYYRRFRRNVIDLVLSTDIASPERTQLSKSKFREAFPPGAAASAAASTAASSCGPPQDESEGGDDSESMLRHVRVREFQKGTTSGAADNDDNRKAPQRSSSLPYKRNMPLRSKRLGIRMSMDLSGEAIEAFSSHSRGSASGDETSDDEAANGPEDDEDEELKALVVLELVLTACDVAHNLQGWSQMCTWSKRLYLELLRAHGQGRGPDPSHRWFENQIGFLEMYLMPLASRLDEIGVFDLDFGSIVRGNLDRWLVEGLEFTEAMIQQGEVAVS